MASNTPSSASKQAAAPSTNILAAASQANLSRPQQTKGMQAIALHSMTLSQAPAEKAQKTQAQQIDSVYNQAVQDAVAKCQGMAAEAQRRAAEAE